MAKSLYEYASSEKNEAKKANSETQLNEETIKKQYEKYSSLNSYMLSFSVQSGTRTDESFIENIR